MDLRRPRLGEVIAGVASAVLLVSLFLPWYDGPSGGVSAWKAFSVLDVLLLLTALMGIAVFLMAITQRVPAVPVATAALTASVGIIASVWVLLRVLFVPGPDGVLERELVWLGLLATTALTTGAWLSMRDEGFGLRPAGDIEATLGGRDPSAEVPVLQVPPPAGHTAGS